MRSTLLSPNDGSPSACCTALKRSSRGSRSRRTGAAGFEPAVEFVEAVLDLLEVGGKRLRAIAPLLHFEEISKAEVLAVDQLVQADFQVTRDGVRFAGTLSGNLGKHGIQGMVDEELFGGGAVGEAVTVRRGSAFGRNGQVEQDGGLLDAQEAIVAGGDGK